MSEAPKAVFLSYASQDAEAIARIAEALRASGVEVWFDKDELVGGDAWDAKIRGQIASCALFVPVISAATQARHEGYFRLEWKLAAQRTHMMSGAKAFLLPVVIDETRDAEAHVPDEFRAVQWTRLRQGSGEQARDEALEKFCARVQRLLGGEGRDASPRRLSAESDAGHGRLGETSLPVVPPRRFPVAAWLAATVVVGIATFYFAFRPQKDQATATNSTAPSPQRALAFEKSPASTSEARKLSAKADALFDQREEPSRTTLELAETLCKQAIALDTNDGEIRAIYARLHAVFIGGSFDSSPERRENLKVQTELAVKLAPGSFEAKLALANYFRLQEVTRAEGIRRLRELVAEQPGHQRAVRTLGHALRLFGTREAREESIIYYDRADGLGGGDPLACYGKYLTLFSLGRDAEAEAALDRAITLQRCGKYLSRKVALAVQRGDMAAAAEAVRQIPTPELLDAEYAYFAVWVWLWTGEPQKALEVWKGISSGYAEGSYFTGPTEYLSGLALHALGREQAAVAAWRGALQQVEKRLAEQPASRVLTGWKAVLLARLGRTREATDLIPSFWQMSGRSGSHHLTALNYRVLAAQLRMQQGEFGPEQLAFLHARSREFAPAALVFRYDPEFSDLQQNPVVRRLASEVPQPNAPREPSTPADAKSVAVLAFKNLSGDPGREFFSDGLSEAVTDVLGRVPGLKVVGSASAFSFKGKAVPIPEIARQLGVTHLVEGTVLQEGAMVRITAKLIKADGFQVWGSDKLDRELKNIFALHDEVAGLIAKNLSLQLGASSAVAKVAVNPQAYELYVEGRRAWTLRGTNEFVAKAEDLFRRAIAADATLGRAYAGLADVLRDSWQGELTAWSRGERYSKRAQELLEIADTALRLEPGSAEAYTTRAAINWMRWRIPEAERDLRAAVRLNPNYADARLILGRVLAADGRIDEALDELKRATELDPLSSRIFDNYAGALREAGRYSEALVQAERALALQPESTQALRMKLSALEGLGRYSEALAIAQSSSFRGREYRSVALLVRVGRKEEAAKVYAGLEIPQRLTTTPLMALGRTDEALASLRPDNATMSAMSTFHYSATFDPIRGDAAFAKFLATLGLTEAHARAQAWRKAHPPEKPGARP